MAISASAVMLGLTAVSTAVGVMGSIQQGQMAQQAAENQAYQANIQGELAELNSRAEAAEMSKMATRMRSTQVAQAAGSGVTLDSGSFMAIVADSATRAEQDRQQVLRTGRLQRAATEAQASSYISAGKSYSQAGWMGAGASLLGGAKDTIGPAKEMGWFE